MKTNQERIEKLRADRMLDREDFRALLTGLSPEEEALLYKEARSVREEIYGKEVYLRGLVEFSSYCRNDCYYCGLRRSNPACQRYRLTKEEILDCLEKMGQSQTVRGEALTLEEFARLSDLLEERK